NLNRPWTLAALASLTALALTVPAPAVAQDCDASWSQPYVCGMRLYGAHAGQRPSELDPRRTIQLAPGAEIDLEVIGIDQRGRSFPNGRMAVGVDSDRNCRELLDWDVEEEGRVHIRAGNSR